MAQPFRLPLLYWPSGGNRDASTRPVLGICEALAPFDSHLQVEAQLYLRSHSHYWIAVSHSLSHWSQLRRSCLAILSQLSRFLCRRALEAVKAKLEIYFESVLSTCRALFKGQMGAPCATLVVTSSLSHFLGQHAFWPRSLLIIKPVTPSLQPHKLSYFCHIGFRQLSTTYGTAVPEEEAAKTNQSSGLLSHIETGPRTL